MRLSARALPLAFAVLLPLLAVGCGGDEPAGPPKVFSAPDYAYLTKIRLNVGEVVVEDHSQGGGDQGGQELSQQAPTPPAAALRQMATDRLFAAGTSGRAIFSIDQASILRAPNGTLSGLLAIHLELLNNGVREGYAEARVARQHVPGSDAEDLRSTLYDLTSQMMADMNVELEFQVRKSLKAFLVPEGSVPLPVEAQPLQQSPAPFAAPPPQPAPPSYTPEQPSMAPPQPYGDPGAADQQQQQMSPPPGYLQAPPGY